MIETPFSVFDPELCCNHKWYFSTGRGIEVCSECGATCARDSAGEIINYNRPATGMGPAAEPKEGGDGTR